MPIKKNNQRKRTFFNSQTTLETSNCLTITQKLSEKIRRSLGPYTWGIGGEKRIKKKTRTTFREQGQNKETLQKNKEINKPNW